MSLTVLQKPPVQAPEKAQATKPAQEPEKKVQVDVTQLKKGDKLEISVGEQGKVEVVKFHDEKQKSGFLNKAVSLAAATAAGGLGTGAALTGLAMLSNPLTAHGAAVIGGLVILGGAAAATAGLVGGITATVRGAQTAKEGMLSGAIAGAITGAVAGGGLLLTPQAAVAGAIVGAVGGAIGGATATKIQN